MKFWELTSIMRTRQGDLEKLLQEKNWSQYLGWYADMSRIVKQQDRRILDSNVPEELALAAMALFPDRFQVRNGYLYGCPEDAVPPDSLSALDAYKRYGGTAIEDVLERGAAKVN